MSTVVRGSWKQARNIHETRQHGVCWSFETGKIEIGGETRSGIERVMPREMRQWE